MPHRAHEHWDSGVFGITLLSAVEFYGMHHAYALKPHREHTTSTIGK